jgi:glyceraldehyde 3-phosphate dehydrogenase
VRTEDGALVMAGRKVPIFAEKDPAKLPWKALGATLVLECTGLFTSKEKASAHLRAGAERVIISAPGGSDVDATLCVGINLDAYDPQKHTVVSNSSCTTNCLAPIAKVLHERFGIVKGHMVTVHSYTNDQNVLDGLHKDLHRARSAAVNIIPTSTGAARAVGLVLPELAGTLDGIAVRVPVEDGSLTDLSVILERPVTADEINAAYREAADGPLKGVLRVCDAPIVSRDVVGDPASCILDAPLTQANGELVKVFGWYDNEWGYTNRLLDLTEYVAARLPRP